jgi:hypothetical protein
MGRLPINLFVDGIKHKTQGRKIAFTGKARSDSLFMA